jgi:uncharacterized alkaline shock family protein YloU
VRSNRAVEAAHSIASPLGRITIANEAVAQIVGHTAAECYGVVGMVPRGGRVGRLLARDRLTQGVEVESEDGGVGIDLRVVVEYGLNLAEVATSVRSRVAYEVERQTGLRVARLEVHIEDVRRTA